MPKKNHQHGFTILEILVAVTIMGLAYVAILQNFAMSARSIARMDEGRTALFTTSLAFEQTLLRLEEANQGGGDEVVAEGGRYQLSQVVDENDDFMTLKIQKK